MLTRRLFLTGASALTLSLYMPPIASAPPIDQEALKFVSERVRVGFAWWDEGTRKELLKSSCEITGVELDFRQMSKLDLVSTTDRLLRASFRALKMAAKEDGYDFPVFQEGKLTLYGQNVVMGLPLAPSDWWPPELFEALNRLAPHYLA